MERIIATMDDLTTSELFAFAQPEDFEKIGVEKPCYSDAAFHDFSSDMEEIEMEEAESEKFVLSRGARAERRRRTRNYTAAKRRVFIRIFDLSGDMENMDERVKRIILKTPDRVQRGWHMESNWWRDEYDRIKAHENRKEMNKIRQKYLGKVDVEENPEEKPEELFVQEENSVFDNYMAAFSEDEFETVAKAAAILGISEEWLFYLSFENEERRKQAKASA